MNEEERFTFHRGVMIILAALFLGAVLGGCLVWLSGCATVERVLMGTELEQEIHTIKNGNGKCLDNAIKIAEVRHKHGLRTRIVIAYSYAAWHAYCRDEKSGELIDTTHDDPLATPMFEFKWVPNMSAQGNTIFVQKWPWIRWELWEQWPKYDITFGGKKIYILRKSMSRMLKPRGGAYIPCGPQ